MRLRQALTATTAQKTASGHPPAVHSLQKPLCQALRSAGKLQQTGDCARRTASAAGRRQPALEPAPTQPECQGRHLRREEGQRVRRNVTEAVPLQRPVRGRERLR